MTGQLFDLSLKGLSKLPPKWFGDKIESTFSFSGQYKAGHSVEGNIPFVIYPFGKDSITSTSINTHSNKCKMYFMLNNIIKIKIHYA